jgi:hypothetical protein
MPAFPAFSCLISLTALVTWVGRHLHMRATTPFVRNGHACPSPRGASLVCESGSVEVQILLSRFVSYLRLAIWPCFEFTLDIALRQVILAIDRPAYRSPRTLP